MFVINRSWTWDSWSSHNALKGTTWDVIILPIELQLQFNYNTHGYQEYSMTILLIEIWIQLFAKKVNVVTCLVVLNYLIKFFFFNWNIIENDMQLKIL